MKRSYMPQLLSYSGDSTQLKLYEMTTTMTTMGLLFHRVNCNKVRLSAILKYILKTFFF